jgi:hypothetical protein
MSKSKTKDTSNKENRIIVNNTSPKVANFDGVNNSKNEKTKVNTKESGLESMIQKLKLDQNFVNVANKGKKITQNTFSKQK